MSPTPDKAQQAIADYLNALLQEEPATPARETSVQEKSAKLLGLDQLIAEVDLVPAVDIPVAKPEVMTPVVTEDEVIATPVTKAVYSKGGVPDWAGEPFQCLLFKVSGLTLAVPLVKLNSVIPWTDKITQTPNKTPWYLGLVNSHESNVKVIDTAMMVLPENRRSSIDLDPAHRFSHILLVDNYSWGLACDAIGEVIWLDQHKVKWRSDKTQRPWLAGTVLEHLCAIMDTEVFAQMMNINTGNH